MTAKWPLGDTYADTGQLDHDTEVLLRELLSTLSTRGVSNVAALGTSSRTEPADA